MSRPYTSGHTRTMESSAVFCLCRIRNSKRLISNMFTGPGEKVKFQTVQSKKKQSLQKHQIQNIARNLEMSDPKTRIRTLCMFWFAEIV